MSDVDRGQVNKSAAEIYEAFFLPALLQEWGATGCRGGANQTR